MNSRSLAGGRPVTAGASAGIGRPLPGVIATATGPPGAGFGHLALRSPSPATGPFDSPPGLPPAQAATPEQGAAHG